MHVNGQTERHVLVIDDDELSREVLTLLLTGEGFTVDTAGSGEEALEALPTYPSAPGMILMDLQMPGLSGEDLAQRLRALCPPTLRLIAISGSGNTLSGSPTFDAFLLKPFSMDELSAVLDQIDGIPESPPPHASSTPQEQVLDPQIFQTFRSMLAAEPLRELYGLCLGDAEKQLASMHSAAAQGDDHAFRSSAHAIKGSLGMLGARELQGMCGLLEEAGLTHNHAATLADFPLAIGRLRSRLGELGVQRLR
ncbi:MAG: hypothetical protein NVSMB3_03700 [Acidobacteriaceae bacterium]